MRRAAWSMRAEGNKGFLCTPLADFRPPRSLRGRQGFTFNEILIAVVVLALAMLPSVNMLFQFRSYTLHTEDVNLALQLANEKLEEYKHLTFQELSTMDGNHENGPVTGQSNLLGFPYDGEQWKKFKRKVHIKTAYNGDEHQVLITVHVWWHDKLFDFNDGRFVRIAAVKTNEDYFW